MSKNHILEAVVEKLTTELSNRCTEYGFKKRVKSKLPNLKLSVKTLVGHVLVAENKYTGKGYASIHLNKNWYLDSTRYKTRHSYRIFIERAYRGLLHLGIYYKQRPGYLMALVVCISPATEPPQNS